MIDLRTGDALQVLRTMPSESVQCVVTSPPYWQQRDYGCVGQIGHEETVEEYIEVLVEVFREVKRVLRVDGTLWLNLGDAFGAGTKRLRKSGKRGLGRTQRQQDAVARNGQQAKQLLGIPWRVALALQADGWILRSEVIWQKPNAMPESVTDRPTRAHEYVFLFTRSQRYYYDHVAIQEESVSAQRGRASGFKRDGDKAGFIGPNQRAGQHRPTRRGEAPRAMRNARSVWQIPTEPLKEGHYAAMPTELARRCILAGTSPQVCGRCGSPYRRVLGEPEPAQGRSSGNHSRQTADGTRGRLDTHLGSSIPYEPTVRPTIGWEPTCSCNGTAAQACPTCGTPWVRIVERTTTFEGGSGRAGRSADDLNAVGKWQKQELQGNRNLKRGPVVATLTTGWQPGCTCAANDGSGRCVVLDPFAGAGTTILVAAQLGRDAIGIDLSPEYVDIARRRLHHAQTYCPDA